VEGVILACLLLYVYQEHYLGTSSGTHTFTSPVNHHTFISKTKINTFTAFRFKTQSKLAHNSRSAKALTSFRPLHPSKQLPAVAIMLPTQLVVSLLALASATSTSMCTCGPGAKRGTYCGERSSTVSSYYLSGNCTAGHIYVCAGPNVTAIDEGACNGRSGAFCERDFPSDDQCR